jgi:GNAT superfamily N-acetyltransferase
MSRPLRLSVEPDALAADIAAVQSGLRAFNVARIGDPEEEPVQIFLRDDTAAVVGGLLGHIRWRWLYVAKLWIDDAHRGGGHGAELMAAAESHARAHGCLGAYLDTFEYQARPFYEKLGYRLFGTLEGYPPGYRQYHLAKRLDGTDH